MVWWGSKGEGKSIEWWLMDLLFGGAKRDYGWHQRACACAVHRGGGGGDLGFAIAW